MKASSDTRRGAPKLRIRKRAKATLKPFGTDRRIDNLRRLTLDLKAMLNLGERAQSSSPRRSS